MKYILLLFLSLFVTSLPIISFSQVDHPSYPTITQQIPSIDKQSQPGYLILATNIINDSGGTKLASDFTINIVGNSFILASFQALPAPEIKIVSMQEGQYSMSISNSQGYKISQQNQCEGQIKSGEVKTCLITLDDEATATAPFPPPQTGGGGGQQTPPAPSPPPQTGGGGGSSTLPPGSPFHFTTAGDFRYNAETDTNLAANNPDIIVLLGDYSYNGGAQNWWTKNMEAINGKKVIGVVGNHDSPEDDFLALFPENGGKWEYIYKVSNVAFVAFDTENNDPSTLDPLLQQAQADPTVAHIIPFGHKTVFTPTANPLTPDADDGYFDVFKKYDKIRMILGGHNHFYARMNAVPETSFIYVTVGNGGANPHKDSGESGSPPQQYVRSNGGLHCYVNNDTISCRMISNEGKVWDEFTIKPGNPPQSSQDPEQAPAGKDSYQRAITQQIPSTITQQIPSTITQQIPSIAKQLQPGFLSNKYY
ncbi:MAG TPA: metallophosphoesterase [Nitrososphaeraceae archaeon]|nr:metallophosphoesterase [Nitrososphaeraceae archaeon]